MKKFIAAIMAILMVFSVITVAFAEFERIDYLLLGDSIAYGAGLMNHNEACYGKVVCNTNGYNYINDAVNGYKTDDVLNQMKKQTVIDHIKEAEIINISIGGNDVRKDNILWLVLAACFGNFKPITSSVEKFYKNFSLIIEGIKEINPDAVILVQTVYNPYGYLFNNAFGNGTDILNESFYKYEEENPGSITVVDIKSAFKGEYFTMALDTFHPNGKGNKIIAREILITLKELGLGEATEPVILEEPIGEIAFPIYWLIEIIRRGTPMPYYE